MAPGKSVENSLPLSRALMARTWTSDRMLADSCPPFCVCRVSTTSTLSPGTTKPPEAASAEIPRATQRLDYLIDVQEKSLEPLRKHREREGLSKPPRLAPR